MLTLTQIKKTEPRLLSNMSNHYSAPKGFVGRSICYSVEYAGIYYGSIVGGSSTLFLPGRDDFFGLDKSNKKFLLSQIVNNVFFHIEKVNNRYPTRNFFNKVLAEFRLKIIDDWRQKYNDDIIGFETLIELPRSGNGYIRDKWHCVGQTKGYTCKRVAGKGTDSWSGKRVWDMVNLRPKLVFCRYV